MRRHHVSGLTFQATPSGLLVYKKNGSNLEARTLIDEEDWYALVDSVNADFLDISKNLDDAELERMGAVGVETEVDPDMPPETTE